MTCPQCGANTEPDANFCVECGEPLVSECPSCGAPLEEDAEYCVECGGEIALSSKRDRGKALLVSFFGGLAAIFVGACLELGLLRVGVPLIPLLGAGVGLIEEPLKVTGLALVAVKWPESIETKKMWILCGVVAGAVFGVVETAFLSSVISSIDIHFVEFLSIRLALTIPLHMVSSGIVGLGIYYKVKEENSLLLIALLASSILLHSGFNSIILKLSGA